MKNIVLYGFMGAGKSYLAVRLAKKLKLPVWEADEMIAARENASIPEVFAHKGEEYFREAEQKLCADFARQNGAVLSAGGGMMTRPKCRAALKNCVKIFLDLPFETCYGRIAGDQNRPVARINSKEELAALYKKRRAVYLKCADLVVSEVYSGERIKKIREFLQND